MSLFLEPALLRPCPAGDDAEWIRKDNPGDN